jgi:hypothetical protein
MLLWKLPMKPGDSFSDLQEMMGYDNLAGVERTESTEVRFAEAVGEEILLMPAKIRTVKLRSYGSSWGIIKVGGIEGRIFVTFQENVWYSPEVGEVVKSSRRAPPYSCSAESPQSPARERERVLVSYT